MAQPRGQQNNSFEDLVLSEIKVIKEIGIGTYGKVSKAEYYGSHCAVKEFSQILPLELTKKDTVLKRFRRIAQLRHSQVVQCLGIFYKPGGSLTVPLLVMEMMDCSLSTLLKDYPNLSIDMKLFILLDVSLGLKFLHCQKPGVVHCSLSSNKVLLTPHLQAKISDVGVTTIIFEKSLKRNIKTTCFVAPEIIKSSGTLTGKGVDSPVDVFSFGAIMLHTFTQQLPEPKKQLNSQSNQYQSYIDKIISYDKDLGLMGGDCLNNEPYKRPRIEKVSEKIKRLVEKCGIKKSTVVLQSELKEMTEERNQLERKTMLYEVKQKEIQQLKEENDCLRKQIRDTTVQDVTEDESTLKKMVKDLEDQLELKTSEIDRLYEQISSILLINKSNDALSNKCESPNSKDYHSAKLISTEIPKDGEQPTQEEAQSDTMTESLETVTSSKEYESTNPNNDLQVGASDVTSYTSSFMKSENVQLPYKLDESGPKIVELQNLGNTCYFNSMLQCINQTVGLHFAVAEGERNYVVYNNNKDESLAVTVAAGNGKMTRELRSFFQKISTCMPRLSSFSPSSLLDNLSNENSRFGRGTQGDSHEALRCLLFSLRQEEIKEIEKEITNQLSNSENIDGDAEVKLSIKNWMSEVSKGITVIDNLIGIRLVSTIVCHDCAIPLQIEDLHMDLSLPMPVHSKEETVFADQAKEIVKSRKELNAYLKEHKYYHAHSTNEDIKCTTGLEQSLSDFTDLDILDENNKFACRNCSKLELQRVSRLTLIHHLSPVLILQLKRFSIGSCSVTKDDKHVSFPQVLNMTPYCTSECVEKHADKNLNILYGLYAVVVHHGFTLHSGHYTAFVRQHPAPALKKHLVERCIATQTYDHDAAMIGKWYYASDSFVNPVYQISEVQRCQAYILFYERLPTT